MNACKYILDAQPSYMVGDAIKHYVKEHLDKKGKGNGN